MRRCRAVQNPYWFSFLTKSLVRDFVVTRGSVSRLGSRRSPRCDVRGARYNRCHRHEYPVAVLDPLQCLHRPSRRTGRACTVRSGKAWHRGPCTARRTNGSPSRRAGAVPHAGSGPGRIESLSGYCARQSAHIAVPTGIFVKRALDGAGSAAASLRSQFTTSSSTPVPAQ